MLGADQRRLLAADSPGNSLTRRNICDMLVEQVFD
jgi:hypothetical protein